MRILLTVCLAIVSHAIFAQQTITWLGGAPGNETNWHVSKNWSPNRVPDEDSYVVIQYLHSGHNAQPVISGEARAASIQIVDRAYLTIEKGGELVLDGTFIYTQGFVLMNSTLINRGRIALFNLDADTSTDYFKGIQNTGIIILDNEVLYHGNSTRIQRPAFAKKS